MMLDNLTARLRIGIVSVFDKRNGNVQEYFDDVAATQRAAYNQFLGLVAGNRFDYPGSDYINIRCMFSYIGCIGEAISITTQWL
jgi:hypothetical protein